MSRFIEFNFGHPMFLMKQEPLKELYLKAYKSKMSGSQWIEEMLSLNLKSHHAINARKRYKNGRQYRKPHPIHEVYQKLDSKYNFFGHYDD